MMNLCNYSGSLCPQFGVLVDSFSQNQISYWLSGQNLEGVTVFSVNHNQSVLPINTIILPPQNVIGFIYPCIATSMQTAEYLLKAVGPTQKYFFIPELFWMTQAGTYKTYAKLFQNLKLIVRSQHYADIIKKYWGISPPVLEKFHVPLLRSMLYEQI